MDKSGPKWKKRANAISSPKMKKAGRSRRGKLSQGRWGELAAWHNTHFAHEWFAPLAWGEPDESRSLDAPSLSTATVGDEGDEELRKVRSRDPRLPTQLPCFGLFRYSSVSKNSSSELEYDTSGMSAGPRRPEVASWPISTGGSSAEATKLPEERK